MLLFLLDELFTIVEHKYGTKKMLYRRKILIIELAYPTPSYQYIETVCTVRVTEEYIPLH